MILETVLEPVRYLLGLLAGLTLPFVPLVSPFASAQEPSTRAASIRFGGRVHAQYRASSAEDGLNEFVLRRARLLADVTLNDFIDGRVQADFAGGDVELKDAWVRFGFSPEFRVAVGQFKRAFDLFELSSTTDLSIIERDGRVSGVDACAGIGGLCTYGRFTDKLGYAGRDIGIRVDGRTGKWSWLSTITNGAGSNAADENEAKSFSGRLTFSVSDELRISGQVGAHDFVGPDEDDEYAVAWAGDVEYGTWRSGFHLQAGVTGGDNWRSLDLAEDPVTFVAVQGVASYYVTVGGERVVGIEPLARVSWGDPDTDIGQDAGVVLTPGLMAYVGGKNKLGFNLDIYSPQTGDTEVSFKLQSFLYF